MVNQPKRYNLPMVGGGIIRSYAAGVPLRWQPSVPASDLVLGLWSIRAGSRSFHGLFPSRGPKVGEIAAMERTPQTQ